MHQLHLYPEFSWLLLTCDNVVKGLFNQHGSRNFAITV